MNKVESIAQFIDVEKVFKEKNATLARFIPGFVFRYIKRVVHQEEINVFIKENVHLQGLPFVQAVLDNFNIKIIVKGNLETGTNKRFVFAANHPLGGMEGVAMTKILVEKYGDIRVPVNDILVKLKNFSPYFIPINKHGSNSRDAVLQLDSNFDSDIQILMFPAGFVSRKKAGIIKDSEWKKTFITKAIKHKRDIVPVFIDGQNSNFFYRLAIIRTFLKIKANLEMFYLSDEMFKQRNRTLTFTFGKPIPWSYFDKSMKQPEWAEKMRDYIYCLRENESIEFEDFIKK